jgi:putative transposase
MPKPKLRYQDYYERNLPHLHSFDNPIFITWRLAFTLPALVKERIKDEVRELSKVHDIDNQVVSDCHNEEAKKHFAAYDRLLASDNSFPQTLNDYVIAGIVEKTIQYFDHIQYEIVAYCVMPNHVHLIIIPKEDKNGLRYSLARIMHSIKRHSANEINKYLKRTGAFWQREYYDHVLRNDIELARCINYILSNPVKAKLAYHWNEWKHTYLRDEYNRYIPSE